MCLQFKGDYWLWHLYPAQTENFVTALDEHVLSIVQTCMGVNINTAWSDFAKLQLALPIRFNGMGIHGATADCRFSQFIGRAVQSIIPLLDHRDDNKNILQGRRHLSSISNLFGNESFHQPNHKSLGAYTDKH
eukprot:scaffold9876_cov77-Cyclotella_meneghiniana.AAC.6